MAAEHTGPDRCGVFEVGQRNAAEALCLAWGDLYQDIDVQDGRCTARRRDGSKLLTGETPDRLNAAIRADWESGGTP